MLDTILSYFSGVTENFRLADLIDIIFVSAFFYTIINILRKSVSRKLLITISVFIVIYILSRLLEMYLTEMLIKILIIFISVAAVIIFQPDIRRMVDSLSRWVTSRHKKYSRLAVPFIDVVTESVSRMAETKTGALIAIKGKEDWDYCVNGGISLDGIVSKPLLLSIFNTKSPGHDGAVLIENGNIIKFGAHLTLSINMDELQGKGTRHAAGLGLSECCDAFIIIVSEERGIITVAENGKLISITSTSELKDRLEKFWTKYFVKQTDSFNLLHKNMHFKTALASITLAIVGWFLFAYQTGVIFKSFNAPIEFRNMRSDLELKEPIPTNARITLSGSEQAFRLLDPADLFISVDLNRLDKGLNEILISEDNLKLPSKIKLYNIEPYLLRIHAEKLKIMEIPVKIQTTGRLPHSLTLESVTSNPNSIKVRIPENKSIPKQILTEPVNLNNIIESSSVKSRIIPLKNIKLSPDQKSEVVVELKVAHK